MLENVQQRLNGLSSTLFHTGRHLLKNVSKLNAKSRKYQNVDIFSYFYLRLETFGKLTAWKNQILYLGCQHAFKEKFAVFSVAFSKKNPTITVASFFSSIQRDRSTFLIIGSTSSTLTTDLQNILETPEPRPKQKHRRPEPR